MLRTSAEMHKDDSNASNQTRAAVLRTNSKDAHILGQELIIFNLSRKMKINDIVGMVAPAQFNLGSETKITTMSTKA